MLLRFVLIVCIGSLFLSVALEDYLVQMVIGLFLTWAYNAVSHLK